MKTIKLSKTTKTIKTTKKMKATKILTAVVLVSTLFMSCKKDDDAKEASIIGTWNITSRVNEVYKNDVLDSATPETIDEGYSQTLVLNADNTFSVAALVNSSNNGAVTIEEETITGTYTLDGDTLNITIATDTVLAKYTLENNTLTLTVLDDESIVDNVPTKYVTITTYTRQ